MGKFLIITGILNLIYFAFIKSRSISFSEFFLLIGILLIIFGAIYIKFIDLIIERCPIIFLMLKVVMIIIIISFITLETAICYDGSKKQYVKSDYVVILGAGLWGETPSDILYKRMDAALDYIHKYPEVKVILSGGKGPGEIITEAEAMKRYLIQKGVPEKMLFKEEKSTSTEENIKYTKTMIRSMNDKEMISVTLVTSNFHILRSKLLAQKEGFKVYVYSAPILSWLIPTYYTREYFALMKYFLIK